MKKLSIGFLVLSACLTFTANAREIRVDKLSHAIGLASTSAGELANHYYFFAASANSGESGSIDAFCFTQDSGSVIMLRIPGEKKEVLTIDSGLCESMVNMLSEKNKNLIKIEAKEDKVLSLSDVARD